MHYLDIIKDILKKKKTYPLCKFKKALVNFIKLYTNNSKLKIKFRKKSNLFYNESKTIVLSNETIKQLYDGDIKQIFTVFLKIAHYQIDMMIENNELDDNLYTVIVEKELRKYERDNDDYNDNFYLENYLTCAIRNYAIYIAVKNSLDFIKFLNLYLSDDELFFFKNRFIDSINNLNIEYRSFHDSNIITQEFMTIDEIYNFLVSEGVNLEDKYPNIKKFRSKRIKIKDSRNQS